MSKKKRITLIAACALLFVALVVLSFLDIRYVADAVINKLIKSCVERAVAIALVVLACVYFSYAHLFGFSLSRRALLWCIPALLVALANFPYSALITGTAHVDRAPLVPLFALNCLLIALFEELLFRGFLQTSFTTLFGGKRLGELYTLLCVSAMFALSHLANLLVGAGVAATFLQVGYSFLIGSMLSVVAFKSRNLWLCVLLHFIFDFGGLLIPTLGSGVFQDTVFWILTAVCGAACLIIYLTDFIRRKKFSFSPVLLS